MAQQFIALDWDNSEARIAAASIKGDRATIEQAFSVALTMEETPVELAAEGAETGKKAGSPDQQSKEAEKRQAESIGKQIAAAISAHGIGHLECLVAIGRSVIELRQLSLPPVPEEELPDAVRFQAMREFNALDDDWPLDFIPLDTPEEGPRTVLAAAVDPHQVAHLQKICQAAGVKAQHLVLRPCGAAALFGRAQGAAPAESSSLRLLVDLLTDEADLTVMIDRRVVFLRSTRLPAGSPLDGKENATALVGEIRRTMVAAMNTLSGQRVDSIVLCGKGEKHAALAKVIADALGMPATLFDPFEGLELSRDLQDNLPEFPGRFAPLLGMLLTELEQTGHAIDFLHPRQRPVPPSRLKYLVGAGGLVAVVVLGWLGYGWIDKLWVKAQIAGVEREIEKTKKDIEDTKKLLANTEKIKEWKATDVAWLDEFDHLSKTLPPRQFTKLTSLNFTGKDNTKEDVIGDIAAKGMVVSWEKSKEIEDPYIEDPNRVFLFTTIGDKQDQKQGGTPTRGGSRGVQPQSIVEFQFKLGIINPEKKKEKNVPAKTAPVAEEKE
jgi:Tfp pilus assembly PilM family ATPase